MEEAWLLRHPDARGSVHLQLFRVVPPEWSNPDLIAKWSRIRELRRVVTGALEIARRDKLIGASLEAAPVLFLEDEQDAALFADVDLAEIAITSAATAESGAGPGDAFRVPDIAGAAVVFRTATGGKCARCWMILPEVGTLPSHPDLCWRCADAVKGLPGA
jgi:isoleucyl-tRNA synthetase